MSNNPNTNDIFDTTLSALAQQVNDLSKAIAALQGRPDPVTTQRESSMHPSEKAIIDAARASDEAVSMTELSNITGIQRTAVWYHAKRLAQEKKIRLISDVKGKHLIYTVAPIERVVINPRQ
jgi:hypothetical protein